MYFQNELQHFQVRIDKHEHFVKEKLELEDIVQSPEKQGNEIHLESLENLQERERGYAYKVRKHVLLYGRKS